MDDASGAYSDRVMLTKVLDSLTLWCGCVADVRRHPATGETTSRTVARRGGGCPNPEHRPGARVWLIELLPDYGSTLAEFPPAGRNTVVDSVTESILAREKKMGK